MLTKVINKGQNKLPQNAGALDEIKAKVYSNAEKLHKNEERAKQGYDTDKCKQAGNLI